MTPDSDRNRRGERGPGHRAALADRRAPEPLQAGPKPWQGRTRRESWLVREPARKGRIEAIPAVLAQLAEAAQAAMDAYITRDGRSAWAALVTADLLQVEPLCRAGMSHNGAHASRSRNDT